MKNSVAGCGRQNYGSRKVPSPNPRDYEYIALHDKGALQM